MRRIIATPATRPELLRVLHAHLARQKGGFDEWHLWVNTDDAEALREIYLLAADCPWIRTVSPEGSYPQGGRLNLFRFYAGCTDPDAAYLRLAEDIVWMDPAFVGTLFECREARPHEFLVFANVVNNHFVSRIHERLGRVTSAAGRAEAAAHTAEFAEDVHREFLASAEAGRTADWTFAEWKLLDRESLGLDAFAWLGAEFGQFEGRVAMDEEPWLCTERPSRIGRHSVVCGRALCVKYAAEGQGHPRPALLDRYIELLVKSEPSEPSLVEPEPSLVEPEPSLVEPEPSLVKPEPSDTPETPETPEMSSPTTTPAAVGSVSRAEGDSADAAEEAATPAPGPALVPAPPPAPRKKRPSRRAATVVNVA